MFFKVENHLLVLDKDFVRDIPEFKAILVRDQGSDGDAQGRKKLMAYRELGYVSFIADRISLGQEMGLNMVELDRQARNFYGLPKNWEPDDLIRDAIKKYVETYSEYPVVKNLRELRRSARNEAKVLEIYNDRIEALIRRLQEEENPLVSDADFADVDKFRAKIEALSKSLANTHKNIEAALEQAKKLEGQLGIRTKVGGHPINPREVHPDERKKFRTDIA